MEVQSAETLGLRPTGRGVDVQMEGRVKALSHVELPEVELFRGRDWEEQSVEFMMCLQHLHLATCESKFSLQQGEL
jgi:hypothetical protein